MSWDPSPIKLTYGDLDRPYEEGAAEYQDLMEKQVRLWMLERWRAFQAVQAMKAAPEAEKTPAGELPAVASFW
ncbi:hypothetical protein IPV08_08290 [Methylobacterium sp. SD274]|uniref:Uncharacterized protein n=1 Tax=Methylobacterium gossipiicola TaxID=582675 RepID=A0A1I2V587_9HYPH|nr:MULTISPECIES: hypothetical protein [Methylobacterium]MBO1019962.1 hypothetical protein [Methylobacterium sp. SD274]SFG82466.1 hypothetical protein SAMN05192565_112108 [Methylobacterium gossipiicola]